MIKIAPEPTFQATVQFTVPGVEHRAPVVFTFVHLGKRALREWIARDDKAEAGPRSDPEFFGEVVRGWAGVLDPQGDPVPYSAQGLAALLDAYPLAGTELLEGYLEAYGGAARKNSERRPGLS